MWKEKYCNAQNIPGTFIWTIDILTTNKCHEFYIEVICQKSSGYWKFKNYYYETMQSSKIQYIHGNSIYYLVFSLKDKDIYESGFIAFCSNILHRDVQRDQSRAFKELEAMCGLSNLHIDICVNFRGIKLDRVKNVVAKMIKSLPGGLHARYIPAFCFIIYNIVSDPVLITKRSLVDEEMAKKLVELFPLMLPDDGFLQHMNKIGAVLEQLYICALGKKACLIGFIMQTVKFLAVDFLLGLVKKVVGPPDSNMPLYIEQSNLNLGNILLKLLQETEMPLLETILRHLMSSCSLREYITAMCVLLEKTRGRVDIHEKLIDSCKQNCNQCLIQVNKTSDLKHLLEHWKIIQSLDPYLNSALHSVVENGILECLKCNAKLTNFEKHKSEFLNVVVDGPLFGCIERKTALLKRLTHSEPDIRNCVLDLLTEEKFQCLPDDSNTKIVVDWLQITLKLDRNAHTIEQRIIRAYKHMHSVMRLPSVQKNKNLQIQIDKLVLSTIEQLNIRNVMKAVSEMEQYEQLQEMFQQHISSILHGKHSKKLATDIIWDICGTNRLRLYSR